FYRSCDGLPGLCAIYRRSHFGRHFLHACRPSGPIRVAMPQFVFLWTDLFLFALLAAVLIYVWRVRRSPSLRQTWKSVARTPSAMCAAVLLCFFVLVAFLDSIHYRPVLPPLPGTVATDAAGPIYSPVLRSALDDLLATTQFAKRENTYS